MQPLFSSGGPWWRATVRFYCLGNVAQIWRQKLLIFVHYFLPKTIDKPRGLWYNMYVRLRAATVNNRSPRERGKTAHHKSEPSTARCSYLRYINVNQCRLG